MRSFVGSTPTSGTIFMHNSDNFNKEISSFLDEIVQEVANDFGINEIDLYEVFENLKRQYLDY